MWRKVVRYAFEPTTFRMQSRRLLIAAFTLAEILEFAKTSLKPAPLPKILMASYISLGLRDPKSCKTFFIFFLLANKRLELMYSRRRHMQYIAVCRSRAVRHRGKEP